MTTIEIIEKRHRIDRIVGREQMSNRGKSGSGSGSKTQSSKQKGPKQQDDEDEEAVLEFLTAQAAANKAQREAVERDSVFDETIFSSLPPRPLEVFPDRSFPARCFEVYEDEQQQHAGFRPTSTQTERLTTLEACLPDLREGGTIHEQVRGWCLESGFVHPGVKLWDMCGGIEEAVRRQVIFDPPVRGLAFPCGCSLNNCAAHYSPVSREDSTVLGPSDVMKIDFGVSINGNITDSAFTVCFDPRFEPLIEASRCGTNTGIRLSGPDARISEISKAIEEVICSYQLELDGHIYPIRPVCNLTGHQMSTYRVHSGKFIPIIGDRPGMSPNTDRMELGEVYALETFATTGKGQVFDDGATSHFMLAPKYAPLKKGSGKDLADCIQRNFKTLAFCQRFLERAGQRSYSTVLSQLIRQKVVDPYPPLSDVKGSWVSQHEHSFAILAKGREVFSRS
jgi:methionyl aminopeptidase